MTGVMARGGRILQHGFGMRLSCVTPLHGRNAEPRIIRCRAIAGEHIYVWRAPNTRVENE